MSNGRCPCKKSVEKAKGSKFFCPVLGKNVPLKNKRCDEGSCSRKR